MLTFVYLVTLFQQIFSLQIAWAIKKLPFPLFSIFQMMPFYVSVILFLCRAWDAITDPLVGYMVSKSGRTRLGKLIPW